ncbi:hypothetical protein EBR56_09665, partial [bacterium]|nr:hypothetical protein [bacterium]
ALEQTLNDEAPLVEYAKSITAELRSQFVRVEGDWSANPVKAKIADAETSKVHTMLVVGQRDLEAGAVRFAAKHGARPRIGVDPAVVFDRVSTVTDREVEPAVGAHDEAVQVVPTEGDACAISRREDDPFGWAPIDAAIAIVVAETVETRDAGQEHVAPAGQDAGRGALDQPVETLRKHGRPIDPPIVVVIDEEPHAVVMLLPFLRLVSEQPQVVGEPVLDRPRRQVRIHPRRVVGAVVRDALVLPKRLAHEHAAPLVDRERDRIDDLGLGGEELHDEALGHAEGGGRLHGLLCCGGLGGGRGAGRPLGRRHRGTGRCEADSGRGKDHQAHGPRASLRDARHHQSLQAVDRALAPCRGVHDLQFTTFRSGRPRSARRQASLPFVRMSRRPSSE